MKNELPIGGWRVGLAGGLVDEGWRAGLRGAVANEP
jgi:hypothetical protein